MRKKEMVIVKITIVIVMTLCCTRMIDQEIANAEEEQIQPLEPDKKADEEVTSESNVVKPEFSKDGIVIKTISYPNEIFPVLCALSEIIEWKWENMFSWEIENTGNQPQTITTSTEILEWSNPAIDTISLESGKTEMISQFPSFKDNTFANPEIRLASIRFTLKKDDKILYDQTRNIKIRASGDMIWSMYKPWDAAPLIVAWVTPRDPVIEQILKHVAGMLPDKTLSGYQREDIIPELKAIYDTLKINAGISYVSSEAISGEKLFFSQRIRFPRESIFEKSANCIDGTVLFASIIENLGLKPIIIIKPGHAFVAIKMKKEENEAYAIETTMIGTQDFDEAFARGNEELQEVLDEITKIYSGMSENDEEKIEEEVKKRNYCLIDIEEWREKGITPMQPKCEIPKISFEVPLVVSSEEELVEQVEMSQ